MLTLESNSSKLESEVKSSMVRHACMHASLSLDISFLVYAFLSTYVGISNIILSSNIYNIELHNSSYFIALSF